MTNIAIAMPDGLIVLQRQNSHWEAGRQMHNLPAQCLAADPFRPERIYCGTFGRGLWRSADGGASWQPVGDGITQQQVMSVAVSPVERAGAYGVVYAGTEPSYLFRSEDGGDTWEDRSTFRALPSAPTWSFPPRPYTHHVRAIGLDPTDPGRLYIAIEAGALLRSSDSGLTWEDRTPDGPRDSHTLATPPSAPGRIYAAAGDGFMAPGRGFAMSHDRGSTWERNGAGLRHHYLWGLAVDPGNPDTLIVSAANSPQQAHNPLSAESAIYRKTADAAWQQCLDGLPASQGMLASSLAANAAEPGVFYAANNQGVFRSPDAGLTWERLAIPWPDSYRMQHVRALLVGGLD
jgi:hypothetical protein